MTPPSLNVAAVAHGPSDVPPNSISLSGLPGPLPESLTSPPHFFRTIELSLNSAVRFPFTPGENVASSHRVSVLGRFHPNMLFNMFATTDLGREPYSLGFGLGGTFPVANHPNHRFDLLLNAGIGPYLYNQDRAQALAPPGFLPDGDGETSHYDVSLELHWNARFHPLLSAGLFAGLSLNIMHYDFHGPMNSFTTREDLGVRGFLGAEFQFGVYGNRTPPGNNPDANFRWFRQINERAAAMILNRLSEFGYSRRHTENLGRVFRDLPYGFAASNSEYLCGRPEAVACWGNLGEFHGAPLGVMLVRTDQQDPNVLVATLVHEQLHRLSSFLGRHSGRSTIYQVFEEGHPVEWVMHSHWLDEAITESLAMDILQRNRVPYSPQGYQESVAALRALYGRFPRLQVAMERGYFTNNFSEVREILGESNFHRLMSSHDIPNSGTGAQALLDSLHP